MSADLDKAIRRNRVKHARWARAERVLRSVRLRMFDYQDAGLAMERKAIHVIAVCLRILQPKRDAECASCKRAAKARRDG